MTTQTDAKVPPPASGVFAFLDKLPGAKFIKNQSIGVRLLIGFGIIVILTLLSAVFSYLGSIPATETITRTNDVRWPTTLASASAQTNLLRMQSDIRSYLVLGENTYRTGYLESEQAFEANLEQLERISEFLSPANQERLKQLRTAFEEWKTLPGTLFALRDDQLEREPAYRQLATDGSVLAGNVLIDINTIIETQGAREATNENLEVLQDMAQFQGTFASLFSALRGYVTTRNRIFRQEYEFNKTANDFAWETLLEKYNSLEPDQQAKLDQIKENRNAFLELPNQIFDQLESDAWRTDLYIFSTEAVPLANQMQGLLSDITDGQAELLDRDLNSSKAGLTRANFQTLVIGLVVLVLGIGLAIVFRENIAGPVQRLTHVAERIRHGDLDAQAQIESKDEIGTLASTFNNMTGKLRATLFQVTKEKKRADDLLNVVIPIGVELSSEKDFNRLLENMLLEAKAFCHANAGILYLRTDTEKNLKFVILRNNTQNIALGGTTGKKIPYPSLPLVTNNNEPNHTNVATHVALTGASVNIADAAHATKYDFSPLAYGDGETVDYQNATSMLTIPIKNSKDEVLGVMQLLDAQDPDDGHIISFDPNLQQMMESFSSLAAAALEAYIREQSLRQEIQQLRIEIDETKRQQQVSEIVESDFFADLQARAQEIRKRGRRSKNDEPDTGESESQS